MNKLQNYYSKNKVLYQHTLNLAIPMILQNLVTNFVSMLDNIMVGQIGTPQMNGVSIVNQLIFVFNITIFGGLSGAGIFGTQFFGKGDHEGQKYTVRFRLILAAIVTAIGMLIFSFAGGRLVSLYISTDETPELVTQTFGFAMDYLTIMVWGLIPFALGQVYSSVVRECGETKIPLYASLAAIGINLALDYCLIFGKFGMPELGVKGAAIATVIAKFIEAMVMVVWAHMNPDKNLYIKGLYRSLYMPGKLAWKITVKGCPLLINEFLWSLGMSVIAQCYSVLGLSVVAARNIGTTITNLLGVFYIQLGVAIGIVIGIKLGAGKLEESRKDAGKLLAFSVIVAVVVAIIVVPVAFLFPHFYNTSDEVKSLATYFILVTAGAIPMWAFTNSSYFILRSGGKTGITFLFDFIYTWIIQIPLAYVLTRFTSMEIHLLIALIYYSEIFKVIVGFFLVRSGLWVNNIVSDKELSQSAIE